MLQIYILMILKVQVDTSQQTVIAPEVQSDRSGPTLFAILSASIGFMTMTVLLYSKGTLF